MCDQAEAKGKNCLFPSDRVSKKSHSGGRKNIFSYFFRNIVVLFDSFCIWILYTTFIWNDLPISKLVPDIFVVFLKGVIVTSFRIFINIKDDWTKYRHC